MTTLPPVLIPTRTFAAVLGVAPTQVREWQRAGAIVAVDREPGGARGAFLYHRDDLVTGLVIRAVQRTCGLKTPMALPLACSLRSSLHGHLYVEDGRLRHRGPLSVSAVHGGVRVQVEVSAGELDGLVAAVEAL